MKVDGINLVVMLSHISILLALLLLVPSSAFNFRSFLGMSAASFYDIIETSATGKSVKFGDVFKDKVVYG